MDADSTGATTDLYKYSPDAVPPIYAVSCHVATDKPPRPKRRQVPVYFSDNLQPIATRGKKARGTLLVDQHCGSGCSIKRAPLSVSYYNEISGGHIGRAVVRRRCSASPVLPLWCNPRARIYQANLLILQTWSPAVICIRHEKCTRIYHFISRRKNSKNFLARELNPFPDFTLFNKLNLEKLHYAYQCIPTYRFSTIILFVLYMASMLGICPSGFWLPRFVKLIMLLLHVLFACWNKYFTLGSLLLLAVLVGKAIIGFGSSRPHSSPGPFMSFARNR